MIEARELLRTTGAVRAFIDQPVDDETVLAVLDHARFAPSGGNRQAWRVVVVKDQRLRRRLAAPMQQVWDEYASQAASGRTPFAAVGPVAEPEPAGSPPHTPNALLDRIQDVPVVLVVAADLSLVAMMDKDLGYRPPVVGGASIYPFCWNVLLAARTYGLAGVLTTFLARAEAAVADDLGLPEGWAVAATIFLGYPVHQPTRLKRNPVDSFTTIDRFDGPALT